MSSLSYYVGLDVHVRTISFCVKLADGAIVREGEFPATRESLDEWVQTLNAPWSGGLEATICSHWIYRHLKPYAAELQMASPARLKAISSAKRKNDSLDARTLADLLRANLFPACYVPPYEYESLRRQLRQRVFWVRAKVMFKNKVADLLIESGVPYQKSKLHQKHYFQEVMEAHSELIEEFQQQLAFNRGQIARLEQMEDLTIRQLLVHPLLKERVEKLQSIKGVGPVTALTWALEIAEPARFRNERRAISYCGLCSAERASAGIHKRGPLSKQRNPWIQTMLVEAAHIAVRYNPELRAIFEAERQKRPRHCALLEVARRLVRQLLAVDRKYFAAQAAARA
jgi:transposase